MIAVSPISIDVSTVAAVGPVGDFSAVLTRWFKNKDGGNILYQWVVPKKQRKKILHHLHDGPLGAHLGEDKTLEKLRGKLHSPIIEFLLSF